MLLYEQELKNIKSPKGDTLKRVEEAVESVRNELKSDGDMKAVGIAYENADLFEIKEFAQFLNQNFKKIVVMGIGGSSLGAKTLLALKPNNNVIVIENIDSFSLSILFNSLNLKETGFLAVSKSGKTIECISQTLILMKKVEEELGRDAIAKHFFFLTENKESPITNLANEFGIKTFEHHKTVGGRFSYLSNTGLLPAAIAGLNIDEIRQGAVNTIDEVLNNKNNFITKIVASQIELAENGVVANVVMPYIDRLQLFTEWYRQLWAESLGKDGKGTIPINAIGTIDQHSQLQLYMDGPQNKFYTFIYKDKDKDSLKIENTYNDGFAYLKDLTLDDIMKIEFDSTVEVLNKRKLPIRVINFKEINERSLSQLLMQYMLETILFGRATGTNPFGQPSVEERKILAREMMANFKK
ncbi:MAG: glucose-6-phosphate isomerase [Rickettsiales bacterium]|nr:MAG: glucose-6-phosphate isomerase [Rickettsiales bacterium]